MASLTGTVVFVKAAACDDLPTLTLCPDWCLYGFRGFGSCGASCWLLSIEHHSMLCLAFVVGVIFTGDQGDWRLELLCLNTLD